MDPITLAILAAVVLGAGGYVVYERSKASADEPVVKFNDPACQAEYDALPPAAKVQIDAAIKQAATEKGAKGAATLTTAAGIVRPTAPKLARCLAAMAAKMAPKPGSPAKLPAIPADALSGFKQSIAADGSGAQWYWRPSAPDKTVPPRFLPMTAAPAVGSATHAVLFFHTDRLRYVEGGAAPATGLSDLPLPVPVTVLAVAPDTGMITVQSTATLSGAKADPHVADVPVPVTTTWTVPSASWLGTPAPEWLSTVTLTAPGYVIAGPGETVSELVPGAGGAMAALGSEYVAERIVPAANMTLEQLPEPPRQAMLALSKSASAADLKAGGDALKALGFTTAADQLYARAAAIVVLGKTISPELVGKFGL